MDKYELKLLYAWEESYKKGQLTLWILLALKDGPKHMAAIGEFIARYAGQSLEANEQSLYRSLKRLRDTEFIDYHEQKNSKGPSHKIYSLTPVGGHIFTAFTKRNIQDSLLSSKIIKLIKED